MALSELQGCLHGSRLAACKPTKSRLTCSFRTSISASRNNPRSSNSSSLADVRRLGFSENGAGPAGFPLSFSRKYVKAHAVVERGMLEEEDAVDVGQETRPSPTRSRREFRNVSDSMVEDTLEALGPLMSEISVRVGNLANAMNVIQYLLSLWVTKKDIVKVVQRSPEVLGMNTSNIAARVNYFVDRGCTAGEVGSAMLRDPKWLSVDVDKIEKMARYIEDSGVPSDKVPRVILKFPSVLDLEPASALQPLIDSLQDLIATRGAVERVLERQPMVLELSEGEMLERADVLAKNGLSQDTIASLVFMKPAVLLLPPDVLEERFRCLQGIFTKRRLPNIFKVAPGLLLVRPARILAQYKQLGEYMGTDVAERVVNAFPQALTLSWEKVLLPKLDYILELGLEPYEVVNFPAYLGYSLPDRIRPRCEALLRNGFRIRPHDEVISADNERKLRRFGRSHRDILNQDGAHSVCIQHIVGLRDDEFEFQFGVELGASGTTRFRLPVDEDQMLMDASDMEDELDGSVADEEEEEDEEAEEKEGSLKSRGQRPPRARWDT